ncbi:hypothetical protein B484DRAFT_457112 [Ochromonadaceae sp. CCMP2298]|nr:hypothetical protein B484DRAFT_457112 [Ochromonadaceae sp. CCMP2298]|mmetsp:Transcript_22329/g.49703  ORF Transcript_22329/g.49703 Transcript_22329/m.49703 type:complete len:154 (+) Transcript_22329:176-637(+)
MTARYRRVAQVEVGEEESSKKARAERIERISAKVHAVFWVAAALAVMYFTDFWNVLYSEKIDRFTLNLAIMCFFVDAGIFLYLVAWLPFILKVTAPWEVFCPNMIPMATGFGVLFLVLFIVSFWPVWGMLTPLWVGILMIGFVFSAHFVPWPC